ncbi:MAG TPA: FAD:protein FMN transferase [Chthonomonadales bacterium]|nr:FAD:protein FMN transferase [Chthonomonadales bacterium]
MKEQSDGAEPVTLVACNAMRARFEIALWGRDPGTLRGAGQEALDEVRRIEAQLNVFDPASEVAALNRDAAATPLQVDPRLFRLLEQALALGRETGGAFDIAVGPLLQAWGFRGDACRRPSPEEVEAARALCGPNALVLDEEDWTVRLTQEGVSLDLGAIGKGYALDAAAAVLLECGVPGALLHGGTSTVVGLGTGPDGLPWRIGVATPGKPDRSLVTVALSDAALSVSAAHGRLLIEGDEQWGHVIDPRTGSPSSRCALAAVRCASATESDALSTALLVAGEEMLAALSERPERAEGLVAIAGEDGALQVVGPLASG